MLKTNLSLYRRIMKNLNINANLWEADARLLFEVGLAVVVVPEKWRYRVCFRRLPITKMPSQTACQNSDRFGWKFSRRKASIQRRRSVSCLLAEDTTKKLTLLPFSSTIWGYLVSLLHFLESLLHPTAMQWWFTIVLSHFLNSTAQLPSRQESSR